MIPLHLFTLWIFSLTRSLFRWQIEKYKIQCDSNEELGWDRKEKLILWNAKTNAFQVTDDTYFAMLPTKMPYNCIETIELGKCLLATFFVRSSCPLWDFVDIFSLCCDMKNRWYVSAECQTSDKLAVLLCVQFYETIFCV